jgi:hypothetical protein
MKSTEQLRKELATRKLSALVKKVRPNPRRVGEDLGEYVKRLRSA